VSCLFCLFVSKKFDLFVFVGMFVEVSKSFKNQKRISLSLKQRSEDDNTIKEKIQGVKISESDSQRSSSQGQLSNLQQQNQDNNRNSKSTLHSNKTRKRKFRSQRRGSQSKNQNDQPNRKHPPQKRQKTK
jgi:preprotein translocase subunit SecF